MTPQKSVKDIVLSGLRENAHSLRQISEKIHLLADNLEDMFEEKEDKEGADNANSLRFDTTKYP